MLKVAIIKVDIVLGRLIITGHISLKLKKWVNFKVKSRHSQFEAEKTPAKNVLKVAVRMVNKARTIDKPASGTMNRLAKTMTRGNMLK